MRKLILLAIIGVAVFAWTLRGLSYAQQKLVKVPVVVIQPAGKYSNGFALQPAADPQIPASECLQNCTLVPGPANVMQYR